MAVYYVSLLSINYREQEDKLLHVSWQATVLWDAGKLRNCISVSVRENVCNNSKKT